VQFIFPRRVLSYELISPCLVTGVLNLEDLLEHFPTTERIVWVLSMIGWLFSSGQ